MPLKPEIIQVLERMKVSRIEAAHDASGSAIAKLTTDYARRNVLGSGFAKTAMDEAKLAAFGEAAKGVYVDYLAVAGDARLNDEELRELQTLYGLWLTEFVEGLNRNGLRPDLVDRFLMPARREADIAFGRELLRRQSSSRPKPEVKPGDIRDYFISHAGPDREGFVTPLVQELVRREKTVWFSEFEITLGDSLRGRIDDGLSRSRHGVVVLSRAFFERPWATSELDALVAYANAGGGKGVLPVLHDFAIDELRTLSPLMAGLNCIPSSNGVSAVADAIIRADDVRKVRV